MNRDDMINDLGTIAKSGTENFLSNNKENNFIGQFGVGFYSVFMVSDEVTVISRKAGDNESYFWYSNGKDGYIVDRYDQKKSHGTKIILKIKVSEEKFLDEN